MAIQLHPAQAAIDMNMGIEPFEIGRMVCSILFGIFRRECSEVSDRGLASLGSRMEEERVVV